MDRDKIGKILDSLKIHSEKYTYNSNPVSESVKEEYYKNGNRKAIISKLTIKEPLESIGVRNKDYYLYSENRKKALSILHLLIKHICTKNT